MDVGDRPVGLRFRKTWRIAPGLRLNLSKSGLSASMGGPGVTRNTKILGHDGRRRDMTTIGLPGTGLSYRIEHEPSLTTTGSPGTKAAPCATGGRSGPGARIGAAIVAIAFIGLLALALAG
ncbi:MAG: DUF4236 domain-containing protein [Erythrobacter sp.]